MSDHLAEAYFELEIGGDKYKCAHVNAAARAALRAHIRSERIAALKPHLKGLPVEAYSAALAKTACEPVGDAELFAHMNTEDGMYFVVWHGLRRYHPSFTLDHVRNLIAADALAFHATRLFLESGYQLGEGESIAVTPDYDRDRCALMRFYGLSCAEVDLLAPLQVAVMIEQIAPVKKLLGEAR